MPSRKYVPGKYFSGEPCPKGHVAERLIYNKQCVVCKQEGDRKSNLKASKKYQVKTKYGLSMEEVQQLYEAQGHKCAICQYGFDSTYKTQIDHCHETGNVRGLLCINCNWLLGKSQDNPTLLREAANYLEKSKEIK